MCKSIDTTVTDISTLQDGNKHLKNPTSTTET